VCVGGGRFGDCARIVVYWLCSNLRLVCVLVLRAAGAGLLVGGGGSRAKRENGVERARVMFRGHCLILRDVSILVTIGVRTLASRLFTTILVAIVGVLLLAVHLGLRFSGRVPEIGVVERVAIAFSCWKYRGFDGWRYSFEVGCGVMICDSLVLLISSGSREALSQGRRESGHGAASGRHISVLTSLYHMLTSRPRDQHEPVDRYHRDSRCLYTHTSYSSYHFVSLGP
jgi:hypothetical protein